MASFLHYSRLPAEEFDRSSNAPSVAGYYSRLDYELGSSCSPAPRSHWQQYMDNSHSMGGGCKTSMLWNWNTIDACFISAQWHIRTTGAFVVSVLAVFALVILLEAVRRVARAYDRRIAEEYMARWAESEASEGLMVSQFSRAVRCDCE